MRSQLPHELRALVRETLAMLGEEIRFCYGATAYSEIEALRKKMVDLRGVSLSPSVKLLQRQQIKLKKLSPEKQLQVAQSFALMMELMNVCENAYRSYRLSDQKTSFSSDKKQGAEKIIFVVTAHPTEARNPSTVILFKKIQHLLKCALSENLKAYEEDLRFLIRVLLKTPLAPQEKPTPQAEAEHLYKCILDTELLNALLDNPDLRNRVKFRAWVGGDKDGHPGVNQHVLQDSLSLSRKEILTYIEKGIEESRTLLKGTDPRWEFRIQEIETDLLQIYFVNPGDEDRVKKIQDKMDVLLKDVQSFLGFSAPQLERVVLLKEIFPRWVVPLELRESSDVLEALYKSGQQEGEKAILGMLNFLGEVAPSGDLQNYAQAWIVSMVRNEQDLVYAYELQKAVLGDIRLPIVPLFETQDALLKAPVIVEKFFKECPLYQKKLKEFWNSRYEMMLGYSDSAKESGVLASRILISNSMKALDTSLGRLKLQPIFFHGTGGSIARGGGAVDEQMAWWPPSARKVYKVTVQGEMVARNFASREHLLKYISKIDESCRLLGKTSKQKKENLGYQAALSRLSCENARIYSDLVADKKFLEMVEKTTLYPFLHALRLGSRPSKRGGLGSVKDLRAIPWILCWTQSRVLMPTWWGFAESYFSLDIKNQNIIKAQALKDPLLATYLKHLGFTMAKIELAPWFLSFARKNSIDDKDLQSWKNNFETQFEQTKKLLLKLMGQRNLLWFRPWLNESIHLRRTMIHPLNVLQEIALENDDEYLLRLTVTGIASGMLTSG
jgi:phosphoenolpyruvate carboxylase